MTTVRVAEEGSRPEAEVLRLMNLLVCPSCHSPLSWTSHEAVCEVCPARYSIEDGVPVLVADRSLSEHDELAHEHAQPHAEDAHKHRQAAHFDQAMAVEFETTRPHGTAPLYEWLLREKFRRAVAPLGPRLDGATALVVCGGSGMDAEFLIERGAAVITSDISLGAAKRARDRARRHGLTLLSIVADVEKLPVADSSLDLVYVHDGLHHLERPALGIGEMARAGRAVSITEPAQALGTRLAVKLGIALDKEESGNVVARLRPERVAAELENLGFQTLARGRYLMYYRHEPGRIFHVLSQGAPFLLARVSWSLGNGIFGHFGNKMTVVAKKIAVSPSYKRSGSPG